MSGDFNISVRINAGVSGTSDVKDLNVNLKDLFDQAGSKGADKIVASLRGIVDSAKEINAAVAGLGASIAAALRPPTDPAAEAAMKKRREELKALDEAAKALAKDFAKTFMYDPSSGIKKGIQDTEAEVKRLTADLRAMYAVKAAGNPTKELLAAIELTERKVADATRELQKFQALSGKQPATPAAAISTGASSLGMGSLIGSFASAQIIAQAITATFREMKDAVASVVSEGIKMNEFLEINRLGIATSINAQYELVDATGKVLTGQEAYNAALKISEDQLREIRIAGLETAATSQQLVKNFQAAVAVGASQNIKDIDRLRKLTIDATNAATALGVAQEEVPVAIRAMITGREVEQNTLARILVGTGEQVRMWQNQGQLMDKLNERLGAFSEGAKQAASSWAVVKSNIEEAFQVFSGEVTEGLFKSLRDSANSALSGIFDTKNLGISSSFGAITAELTSAFSGVGVVIADALKGGIEYARQLNTFLAENADNIKAWKSEFRILWEATKDSFNVIVDIVKQVAKLLQDTGLLSSFIAHDAEQIASIGASIAFVADSLKVVVGLVSWLGGALVRIFSLFKAEGEVVRVFNKQWGDALISLGEQADKLGQQLEAMGSNMMGDIFVRGEGAFSKFRANLNKTGEAVKETEKTLTMAEAKGKINDLKKQIESLEAAQTKLLKSVGGKLESSAYAENEKKLASLKKELMGVAALYPSIANAKYPTKKTPDMSAQNALAKADADAALAIAKDRLAREQKELDYALGQQLISLRDYYAKRQQSQLDALAAERNAKQKELAAISATAGKGTENEKLQKQAQVFKLQSEINLMTAKEGDIVLENTRKRDEAMRALTAQVLNTQSQLEQATGQQTVDTIAKTITEKFRVIRAQFAAEFGKESLEVDLVDRLVNVEKAKAAFTKIQNDYSQAMDVMKLKEEELQRAQESGQISSYEASKRQQELHRVTADQLDAMVKQLSFYATMIGDSKLKLTVDQLKASLTGLRTEASELGKSTREEGIKDLSQLLLDLSDSSKTAQSSIENFAKSIFSFFAQLLAKQAAMELLNTMFSGTAIGQWMGLAATTPAAAPAAAPVAKAGGGLITGPGTSTSDSIPAMLSTGEYVLNAASVSQLGVGFLDLLNGVKSRGGARFANGGLVTPVASAEQSLSIKLIQVKDDHAATIEALQSRDGERAVIQHMSRNMSAFQGA